MCLNDGEWLKSRQFKPCQQFFSGIPSWVQYLLRCYEKSGLEKQIEIDKKEGLTLDYLKKISAINNANIETRIKEIEKKAPELKSMRPLGGSLRERLAKLQDRDA